MRNSTPFFAAFGSLLFGRAPRCRLQDLLGQWPQMPSINQYMEAFGEFIPQTLLGRSKEKVNSRQRIFSPLVTFWAFLAQVLERGSSCRDALQRVSAWWQVHFPAQGSPSADTSGYCQAPQWLLERLQIWVDVLKILDEKICQAKAGLARTCDGPRPKGVGALSQMQLQSEVLRASRTCQEDVATIVH